MVVAKIEDVLGSVRLPHPRNQQVKMYKQRERQYWLLQQDGTKNMFDLAYSWLSSKTKKIKRRVLKYFLYTNVKIQRYMYTVKNKIRR